VPWPRRAKAREIKARKEKKKEKKKEKEKERREKEKGSRRNGPGSRGMIGRSRLRGPLESSPSPLGSIKSGPGPTPAMIEMTVMINGKTPAKAGKTMAAAGQTSNGPEEDGRTMLHGAAANAMIAETAAKTAASTADLANATETTPEAEAEPIGTRPPPDGMKKGMTAGADHRPDVTRSRPHRQQAPRGREVTPRVPRIGPRSRPSPSRPPHNPRRMWPTSGTGGAPFGGPSAL